MRRPRASAVGFLLFGAACGEAAPSLGQPSSAPHEVVVGGTRVQALSPSLIRVEPRGPAGFEDRTTFTVVNRTAFPGVPISKGASTPQGLVLTTPYYQILLRPDCSSRASTDVSQPIRSAAHPNGARAADEGACCALCEKDPTCRAWVFAHPWEEQAIGDFAFANCWPLADFSSAVAASRRTLGVRASFAVLAADGKTLLYDSDEQASGPLNLLNWPSPLQALAYAVTDFPRFFVPPWGAVPAPAGASVDPALRPTNGYDFRNNVNGDTYVFLLGGGLDDWGRARAEFLALAGPCPLLPDFAYGAWFTYWHHYSEVEAKNDVAHWENLSLPLDIWALDMNWRLTDDNKDHYYNYPDTGSFPNFTEFFEFLRARKLRTYFNDHPFPVASRGAGGLQTSPEEVAFRWQGLSEWMQRGLTFWWFDHNWKFSIPPPFVNTSQTSGVWNGLDNAAWGSHVYFNAAAYFDTTARRRAGDAFNGGRPLALTKFGLPDGRPGIEPSRYAESPSQHRYPVWWTGDRVDLEASVQTMVDSGVHGLKPFVHSDCGGDVRLGAGDLMRWTAHCAFGSVLRFHGADHRAWTYNDHVVDIVRKYISARYRLLPSLIAAGNKATETGFPLVARGDLFWPEHKESATNKQYIFLEDILVAPLWSILWNTTGRRVWVPPGDWEDAWDGSLVRGPRTIFARQPYERQPMWYRRDGGLLVLADGDAKRVEDQDWSSLTLEAFPSQAASETRRAVVERGSSVRTQLTLRTDGKGTASLEVGSMATGSARAWLLRLHLLPGQRVASVRLNGEPVGGPSGTSLLHLAPRAADDGSHFPLSGAGAAPPPGAGPVAEVRIPPGTGRRFVEAAIESDVLVV